MLTSNTSYKNKNMGFEDFQKFINIIAKDKIRISSDNVNGEIYFTDWFNDNINERIKSVRKLEKEKKEIPEFLSKTIKLGEVKAVISTNKFSLYDESIDLLKESQIIGIERLVSLLNQEKFYTGFQSKDSKNRFLIYPPQLIISEEIVIPIIILTLFKSGHILVHFSYEIKKITANKISGYSWNLKLDKVKLPKEISNTIETDGVESLEDIANIYLQYFKIRFRTDGLVYYMQHLCLPEYAYQPESFKLKESKKFNDGIYRILFAPIFKHQLKNDENCEELLKNQLYNFSKHYNLYANYNRLISCFSKHFKASLDEQLKFRGLSDEELKKVEITNEELYNTSTQAIIIAIENTLIKKSNMAISNLIELNIDMPLNKLIDKEILDTMFYLGDFYKTFYTYESLVRFTEFLENKCENYLNLNETKIRKEKIESIINIKKEKLIYNVTLLGPLLTIILTLLFSYSALESITKGFGVGKNLNEIYIYLNLLFNILLILFFKSQFKELIYIFKKQLINIFSILKNLSPFILKLASKFSDFYF
ncbi:hypothetical protein P4502_12525 [Peribacillus frigoritolerans]|uniref:hypothetical protein n=1 Tax=Peribacillus frigoritolerans TaxID=450367 RepID=UPI002E1A4CD1|nr:hypothetical protein [Peribacillus frigoritolerans]